MDPKPLNTGPSTTPLKRPGSPPARVSPAPIRSAGGPAGVDDPLFARGAAASDPRGLASGILVLTRWIQCVVIGIWMGAIVTIGALVAPAAFHTLHTPAEAGRFIGPLVTKITEMGGICGVVYLVMLMIHDPLWRRYHQTAAFSLLSFLKTMIAAGMVGVSGYLLYRVDPRMKFYQQAVHVVNGHLQGGAGRAFDAWHHLYAQITYGIFAAGLFLLLLTLMSRRRR